MTDSTAFVFDEIRQPYSVVIDGRAQPANAFERSKRVAFPAPVRRSRDSLDARWPTAGRSDRCRCRRGTEALWSREVNERRFGACTVTATVTRRTRLAPIDRRIDAGTPCALAQNVLLARAFCTIDLSLDLRRSAECPLRVWHAVC